jgi:hypothetical protein
MGTSGHVRAELKAERSTEGYARRRVADARRREKIQSQYVEDFFQAVESFLAFHPKLNVIERFWKKLRWRATHNRLCDVPKRRDLAAALKAEVEGDAQPAVRQHQGPQGVGPQQPPLLPDRPVEAPGPHQWPAQEGRQMRPPHRERVSEEEIRAGGGEQRRPPRASAVRCL